MGWIGGSDDWGELGPILQGQTWIDITTCFGARQLAAGKQGAMQVVANAWHE